MCAESRTFNVLLKVLVNGGGGGRGSGKRVKCKLTPGCV